MFEEQFNEDVLMSKSNSQEDKREEYVYISSTCGTNKRDEMISEMPFLGNFKRYKATVALKKSNHKEPLSGWSKNFADREDSCRLHDVRGVSTSLTDLSDSRSVPEQIIWEPLFDLCSEYEPLLNSDEEFPVLSSVKHVKK